MTDQFKNLISSANLPTFTTDVYKLIKDPVCKFKGDSEKFYPDFCYLFSKGNTISELNHQCNILLGFEFANNVLAFLAKSKIIDDSLSFEFKEVELNQKEKEIVSYLSGYVISTLYRRLRFSQKHRQTSHQQCLSFLMACKFVEGNEREGRHNLIDVHNRGGLWKAKRDVVLIFTLAES